MGYLEQGQNLEQDAQHTFLYTGVDIIRFVPEEIRQICAFGVSDALANHPYTMLQFTPNQIFESIENGRAVVALEENLTFVGFAQLWQYGFTEGGRQITEFGSWLSFQKGQGETILREGIKLGKRIDPEAQIVAIVEENNIRAQDILLGCGGKEIGGKFSPYIRTVEGKAAYMKIYDITTV